MEDAEAKDWYQRKWLQSHVRAAMFYALQSKDDIDDVPIMRADFTPMEQFSVDGRRRDYPQGRFLGGLGDMVQELFPQPLPELAAILEGAKAPEQEAVSKRPLTAQVTKIRGATTAGAFAPALTTDLYKIRRSPDPNLAMPGGL